MKRLLALLMDHKKLFFIASVLMGVGTAAILLEPRLLGYAVDQAIIPKDREALVYWVNLLLILTLVRVVALILQSYLFEMIGQSVMQDLRVKLYRHILKLPARRLDQTSVGKLVTRVTNDIASMADMFNAGIINVLGNILVIVGTVVLLVLLDWRLAALTCSILPVLIVFSIYFSEKLRFAYRNSKSRLSKLNTFLAESFTGMRVIHLFNQENAAARKLERLNQNYSDAQVGTVKVFAIFQPTITWCTGIAMAILIFEGGRETLAGTLAPGVWVAFFAYVLALFQPIREVVDKWTIFLNGLTASERVFEILDWETEDQSDQVESQKLPKVRGDIEFRKVTFGYRDDSKVFQDFDLKIQAGERLAIVGHTGAGKTSLLGLLLRFYEIDGGGIYLDGQDLRSWPRETLRRQFGWIQQEVFLFSGSLEENIRLWREIPAHVQSRVEAAARDLGAEELLKSNLQLDERGSNLSLGQRQMISFLRVLAQDPPIWILDEATSSIDTETEETLNRLLWERSEGKTLIMIAHRLSTVRKADRILVLQKGKVIEEGSHAKLLSLGGYYAKLYRYQELANE
jgi:ATP-binding cassette subfamily B protein